MSQWHGVINGVDASGWTEESVVVSTAGQRRSMIEGILTCMTARHGNTLT